MLDNLYDEFKNSDDGIVERLAQRLGYLALGLWWLMALGNRWVVSTPKVAIILPCGGITTVADGSKGVRQAEEHFVALVVAGVEAVNAEDTRRVVCACPGA